MERFAIANRAAQCAQTTGVNTDTRALTIFNNALEVALTESKLSPHSIRTHEEN